MNPSYGSSATYAAKIKNLIVSNKIKSAIDFGCGKGRLVKDLRNALPGGLCQFQRYDPAIQEYSAQPKPAELLIANDVFEHFDPKKLEWELRQINALAERFIFANISCRPAVHILPNGLNAHTCLLGWQQWIEICNNTFFGKRLHTVEWHDDNKNVILIYEKEKA